MRCSTGWRPSGCRCSIRSPLLRWNSDKAYLAELGAKGVPTVPTRLVEALDEAALAEARAEFGATSW